MFKIIRKLQLIKFVKMVFHFKFISFSLITIGHKKNFKEWINGDIRKQAEINIKKFVGLIFIFEFLKQTWFKSLH